MADYPINSYILEIGPIPTQKYNEIDFPILPATLLQRKCLLLKISICRWEQKKVSDFS